MKLLILILFSAALYAQTIIPEGNVSGTWSAAGSPYHITGNITVPDGQTLIIQPGVRVVFQSYKSFFVQGRILAEGTVTDSIVFTSVHPDTGWYGLRYVNTPLTNDTSKFRYCKIEYGKTPQTGTGDARYGGGVFIRGFGKIVFSNCLFQYNSAGWGGAVQARDNASILIEHSTFRNNYAQFSGAAIRLFDFSHAVVRFNKIYNNNVGSGGAGMYLYRSDAFIYNNHFYGNVSNSSGGAVSLDNSKPLFMNNLFNGNTAVSGGALSFTTLSDARFVNNTFSANSASNAGGAMFFSLSSNPTFTNCIIWGNTAPFGTQVNISQTNSDPNFIYCIMQYGTIGFVGTGAQGNYNGVYTNNLETDPLFTGTGPAPFSLQQNSPAVNAGTPDTTGLLLLPFDFTGSPRISGTAVDMGAYEYQFVIPVEFETFSVTAAGGTVKGTWSTLSETNNKEFMVERYGSGGETEKVYTIPGSGTTQEKREYSFADMPQSAGIYTYRLYQRDFSGAVQFLAETQIDIVPSADQFYLGGNYPNPFNPATMVEFYIPAESRVSMEIITTAGEVVRQVLREELLAQGMHTVRIDAASLPAGVYFYKVSTGFGTKTGKMLLLK